MPFLGMRDQERTIDPSVSAFAILDPGQDIFQAVKEGGELEYEDGFGRHLREGPA